MVLRAIRFPQLRRFSQVRTLLLCLAVSACATVTPAPLPAARVYELPEADAKQLVREVLERRGIRLAETEDRHLLLSEPKVTTTEHPTMVPGVSEPVFTHQRTWMAIFQPLSATSTAVRVVRAEALAMSNAAERSTVMGSAMARATIDARLPPDFERDREEEAAVAMEYDSQVSVEVSEGQPSEEPEVPVAALTEPPPAPPEGHPPAERCNFGERSLEELLQPGHFLLLSDPLGAREPWAAIDQLLCLASSRGLPLTLALSLPSREQQALNDYLSSTGAEPARRALLARTFWHRPWQDGRSSEAVFDAI